jgi:formylglycine-generating enzyme required for sulfatase activity
MVLITAGPFVMGNDAGDPDEKPAHTVYLDEYYIDKFEVTNGRYSFCVGSGVCKRPSNTNNKPVENYYSENYSSYPVVNISWEMAKTYCEWRGARLPTEAEWEKAARGGLEGQLYPWGNENPVCDAGARNGAQFKNCQDDLPIRVGLFAANDYQLYDMAGNVWEWVGDWYQADYYSQVASNISNPQGPSSGERRVVRGGSWADANITLANRGSAPLETQDHAIGFRCVRDVLP